MNNKTPKISSYIISGRRRLYYAFPDGSEMVEEYVKETHEIISRRWKKKGKLSTANLTEIGEPETGGSDLINLSNTNPVFLRKDNRKQFHFKIRNLIGYNKEMFKLETDPHKQEIVVRTSNKKYFKRFSIPDLQREGIKLDSSLLSFSFANNTLYIEYSKPQLILDKEERIRDELEKLSRKGCQEGDLECTTQ